MMGRVFAEPLRQVDSTHVLWRGGKLLYFGGCDYLRLSWHPKVIRAVQVGLEKYGLNVAASRKTTGNHPIYEKLEEATAKYFGCERAVLVSNGYLTNLAVAQALIGRVSQAFVDEGAHSSLQDALQFLGAKVERFKHRDAEDLKRKVGRAKTGSVAVLTDGLFAHNGAIAPLGEYRRILGGNGLLWVDDSHAAGVLGKNGRGTVEIAGVGRGNLIQTITFSKGFGVYGGAILTDRNIWKRVVQDSRIVTGNTPLPLPLANAVLTALGLASDGARKKLHQNIRELFRLGGRKPPDITVPIIMVEPRSRAAARTFQRALLKAGIYPSFIRYPGGPEAGYFRFAISAEHRRKDLERLGCLLATA